MKVVNDIYIFYFIFVCVQDVFFPYFFSYPHVSTTVTFTVMYFNYNCFFTLVFHTWFVKLISYFPLPLPLRGWKIGDTSRGKFNSAKLTEKTF